MKLRVRKAPQQPSRGHRTHPSPAKRKRCEVEPSPVRGRSKMQKNETGLFSTIKKFIRGKVKVEADEDLLLFFQFVLASKGLCQFCYKRKIKGRLAAQLSNQVNL